AVGLDLEEVDFIDSAGAHMLGELSAELRASGKRLVVLKESSQVHRVLKMLTRAGLLQL
ncbi:MAG: STAS domain-containing protein, partial [Candidatus Eremiobacteraeota bacterium]|nr:STAS domain-containing protein [Candidatus Eremiobacteraeota bacterium]